MDRRGFGPGAGQRGEAKAAVGGDPGFAVGGIVVGAGDARQHLLDQRGRHRAIGLHIGVQPCGQRLRMRLPLQDLGVVQQHASVVGLQPAVGRHPRIEQAGRFERGFEAGALRSGNGVAKIHQLQERRTRARGSCGGVTCRGQWRRGIDARFETVAFVVEGVALGLQGLTLPVERDAPLRQTQAGLLLRRLQQCRAGLSPSSPSTQSANAASAATLSSGLTCSCWMLPK